MEYFPRLFRLIVIVLTTRRVHEPFFGLTQRLSNHAAGANDTPPYEHEDSIPFIDVHPATSLVIGFSVPPESMNANPQKHILV
jgi:hypothetical protein